MPYSSSTEDLVHINRQTPRVRPLAPLPQPARMPACAQFIAHWHVVPTE